MPLEVDKEYLEKLLLSSNKDLAKNEHQGKIDKKGKNNEDIFHPQGKKYKEQQEK